MSVRFTEVLDTHRVPWHDSGPKTHPGWVNFRCPYCGKDPYMGYHLAGGYCSCWSCGYRRVAEVLHLLTGLPPRECGLLSSCLPREGADRVFAGPHAGKLVLPPGLGPLRQAHRDYLSGGRGLDPDAVRHVWGGRGLGQDTRRVLRWRVWLPVRLRGEVVSWTSRKVGPGEPRYFSATDAESAVPFRSLLYGLDHCRSSCLIVEGPFDAIAVGPGAVATMGVGLTDAQKGQLSRIPYRAVCFDAEPDAQFRARQLARDLSVYPGTTVNVVLETGNDPASVSAGELLELRKLLY